MILHQRSMIKALSVIVDDITCDIIIDNCLCADSDHRWMSVDYPYGIAINNPFSNSAFFFLVKTVYDFVGDHNNITIDSSFQITS